MKDKIGHMRWNLDVSTKQAKKMKYGKWWKYGSLFGESDNSFYRIQNATRLILNENRLIELSIHIKYLSIRLKMREIWIL